MLGISSWSNPMRRHSLILAFGNTRVQATVLVIPVSVRRSLACLTTCSSTGLVVSINEGGSFVRVKASATRGDGTMVADNWSEQVLAGIPDAIFVIDAFGTLVFASEGAERMLGWKAADWVGRSTLELIHPDDIELVVVSLDSVVGKETGSPIDVRLRCASGEWLYVELVGRNHVDDPTIGGIIILARDVTERRRFEVATNEEDLFRSLMHNSAAITMLLDRNGYVLSVSGAFSRMLGYDPELVVGRPLVRWASSVQRVRVAAAIEDATVTPGITSFDAMMEHKDGVRMVPLEFSIVNLIDDPVVGGLVVTAHDITPLREAQDSLEFLATHDPLTRLANRNLLLERIEQALSRARELGPVTVFFVDLDRFKPVNDLLGHDAGDLLLVEIAVKLRRLAREGDTIARLGGDEFVLVAQSVASLAAAQAIAQRVENAVSEPVEMIGGPVQVYASVGFARSDDASTAESLLADADGAMYLVKAERRGDLRRSSIPVSERRAMVEALAVALREDQLVVFYQPLVNLKSRVIVGLEALVRWEHPERGLLLPGDFIGVAEESGLDIALGEHVLRTACIQLRDWEGLTAEPLSMAVNMSAAQLADPVFGSVVRDAVDAAGITPDRLCLEITEHDVLERGARGASRSPLACLSSLREVGVKLAVDDFGTGYSSLTHLRRFPVDVLKIDRIFVRGLGRELSDTSIVRAVVGLARAMDMTSIAEGVEQEAQVEALLAMGCEIGQGYALGRPAPADQIRETLELGTPTGL